MDRKKKIVTILGSLVFLGGFLVFLKLMFFSPKDQEKEGFSILTPKVDENRIPKGSKIAGYDRERNVEREGREEIEDSLFPNGTAQGDLFGDFSMDGDRGRLQRLMEKNQKEESLGWQEPQGRPEYNDPNASQELMELMELQRQLMDMEGQSYVSPEDYGQMAEIDSILKTYQSYGNTLTDQGPAIGDVTVQDRMGDKNTPEGANTWSKSPQAFLQNGKDYFQGAGSIRDNGVLHLVAAETVDQGVLFQGSLVAIRLKEALQLYSPHVLIPKGAVVYGKVSLSADRLGINIESYRNEKKLYRFNIRIYDFDGREGVHLGNRTWPKIPSNVAKDVYEYAYRRGTQASTFGGGNNGVDLDEAGDIALLSATKHIGDEVFEKRRVFMPKNYHLWLNIQMN